MVRELAVDDAGTRSNELLSTECKKALAVDHAGDGFYRGDDAGGIRRLQFLSASLQQLSQIYGAMAGFIILVTWIYVASLILLIGAETDSIVENFRRSGATA